MAFVPKLLNAGVKVIDFSADYRIKDVAVYEKYYEPHTDRENLAHAVYGLPELFRDEIKKATLIANPGCYPTGASLALAPLLANKLIKTRGIVVSSVTGVSGGGKNPSPNFHFPYMNENLYPYGVGVHRHMPEMEQVASAVAGESVELLFQPHVGPFDRGILSSVYCDPTGDISAKQVQDLFRDFYKDERFVVLASRLSSSTSPRATIAMSFRRLPRAKSWSSRPSTISSKPPAGDPEYEPAVQPAGSHGTGITETTGCTDFHRQTHDKECQKT